MAARTNFVPKNATPTRLQLEPPPALRLPFSSPMGEEIVSPTSPTSRTPPQDRRRNVAATRGHDDDVRSQQGLALDMSTAETREQRKEEGSKRPGLNIVTKFPPRTSSAQKIATVGSKSDALRVNGNARTWDAEVGTSSRPQSRHIRQASSKSLKSATSKNRLDVLRRGDSKASNLSPSDRAVMIGISLPPDEVANHAQSAISPEKGHGNLGDQLARNRRPSDTPSILITPANAETPWPATNDETPSPPRPRARSSVYSQSPNTINVIDSSIVPPVPALPPEAKHSNLRIKTEQERPTRMMSTCTIFDEEADPIVGARPDSAHSQLRILKKSSSDTLNTRPRSQGWWNNVMSPFWPRSPMRLKSSPVASPNNSSPAQAHRETFIEDEEMSPFDEKVGGLKSGHTSWTDSPVEEENEKPALTFDQILPSHNHVRSITALQPNDTARDSSFIPARFEGLGAAAEYFEACLHDEHDPTPFFQCQNHRCMPREYEANGIHPDDIGEPSARGLGVDAPDAWEAADQVEPRIGGVAQHPRNGFSPALQEHSSELPRQRPASEATIIEDLDETPDIQEAHVAPIVRAPQPIPMVKPATIREEIEPEEEELPRQKAYRSPPPPPIEAFEQPSKTYRTPPSPPHPLSPPPTDPPAGRPQKRYIAVLPPKPPLRPFEEPISPPPPTPGPYTQAPDDSLPLRSLRAEADASRPMGDTYIINHNYHLPRSGEQTSMADFFPPPKFNPYPKEAVSDDEADEKKMKKDKEKENKKDKDNKTKEELKLKESTSSKLSKLTCCCSRRRKGNGKPDEKMPKRKRLLVWLIGAGLVAMIITILLLAMLLRRKGDTMPVQTQWLNITGYPPIPTGVSTIIQPNAVDEVAGCVNVPDMWSCALPKEQQHIFSSGNADQPNFRVEIRFENGTNATASINSSAINKRSEQVVNPVSAASFIRRRLLQLRDSIPGSLFNPSPSPPKQEEQIFLGNTTDGHQAPFDGEYTPFFMTFDSPAALPSTSRLAKREPISSSSTTSSSAAVNTSDPFPDLTSAIPDASTNQNGTASPANLYPFPSAQPLRLFDRGLPTEHYGFYTYFDRSIFLKSTGFFNGSTIDVLDDTNGGALEDSAKARCTWAQTRFHVQIWTNQGQKHPLLPGDGNATAQQSALTGQNATSLANSSANDFSRPGSFPYPVTITLDRHGGDVGTKEIYCYGLDDSEKPEQNEKKIQLEDRGYRGKPVNPASGPFATNKVSLADGGPGGIDGGSGGCSCKWQNWQ